MKGSRTSAALALIATIGLTGCATSSDNPIDPLEPANRAVYSFNDGVDRAVMKPVAEGYRAVLPSPVRTSVNNFFSNLRDPWTAINQILQGKVEEGANDFMRFVTNSTFGLLGLFDVASEANMPKHQEDFGQTLGVWGFNAGPYLVLPIFGPSNMRDAVGTVVDSVGYLPWNGPEWLDLDHHVAWRNSLTALDFINTRANLLDTTNTLEEAALDRYSFVRDAYMQRRRSQVNDGKAVDKKARAQEMLDLDSARIPAEVQTLPKAENLSAEARPEAFMAAVH